MIAVLHAGKSRVTFQIYQHLPLQKLIAILKSHGHYVTTYIYSYSISIKVPMHRKFQSIANGMKVTFEPVSFDVERY
jgi:hypothetical protein